jgi:uncharacterized protein YndB with AHSA1/START domain
MNATAVNHGTLRLERVFEAAPGRVFAAWADPDARASWWYVSKVFEMIDYTMDFRPGGREQRSARRLPNGSIVTIGNAYEEIVPDARIISVMSCGEDGVLASISLLTIEFFAEGSGTRLIFTEQCASLDGVDQTVFHKEGWGEVLDRWSGYLARTSPAGAV